MARHIVIPGVPTFTTRPATRQGGKTARFSQKPASGSSEKVDYSARAVELLAAAGIPAPDREFLFANAAIGRKWRADLAWIQERVILEIEGGAFIQGRHTRGTGFEEDIVKYNWASVLGYCLIRATPGMLRNKKKLAEIVRQLKIALGLSTLPGKGESNVGMDNAAPGGAADPRRDPVPAGSHRRKSRAGKAAPKDEVGG